LQKEGVSIRVHEKPLARLKERLKAITSRRRGGTVKQIFGEIARLLNGWVGYYRIADIRIFLERISAWLRRRIRQLHWKRWKRTKTRHENLIQLGIPADRAWQWANTRKGYWRTAGSWILTTTLSNRYLETLGFPDVLKWYGELRERDKRLELLHVTC
jgi:hypothetical protein